MRRAGPAHGLAALVALALVAGPMGPLLAALVDPKAFAQLTDPRIGGVFWRSIWMSGLSALLAVLIGVPLSLLARRTRVLGAELLVLLTPLPLLLPPLLLAQGWNGLTGHDGQWASVIVLGLCYAPLPALLTARALATQSAAAHDSALLLGGRRFALAEMLRTSMPAAALGASLAFLFAANDFAVPDYFGAIGETFGIYPGHVYTHFRDNDYWAGARAAAPLVLICALVLYAGLALRDRWAAPDPGRARRADAMPLGRWTIPASLLGWALIVWILLAPLGRIVYELGAAGPLAEGSWSDRAGESLRAGVENGRADLGRSLRNGLGAVVVALLLAPFLAHALATRRGPAARLATTLLALPLLAPGVGYGMGAIAFANRPGWTGFYQGTGLVVLVLAGRFLPIAVFVLAERFQRIPRSPDQAAQLAGFSFPRRLWQAWLAPHLGAWLLAGGLVLVFAVRELDLAILLPGANQSAAVRYFNALHFARDGFVAAFGLLIALVLFLPVMLYTAWSALRPRDDA